MKHPENAGRIASKRPLAAVRYWPDLKHSDWRAALSKFDVLRQSSSDVESSRGGLRRHHEITPRGCGHRRMLVEYGRGRRAADAVSGTVKPSKPANTAHRAALFPAIVLNRSIAFLGSGASALKNAMD